MFIITLLTGGVLSIFIFPTCLPGGALARCALQAGKPTSTGKPTASRVLRWDIILFILISEKCTFDLPLFPFLLVYLCFEDVGSTKVYV